ncbi:MAG: hypothetical protein IKC09_08760 [Oscillospiraceae bacterium]|nr:hypothetical protein [Oscillospiraceae bacterium]
MLTYCNGKKGYCDEPVCTEECGFHNNTGGRLVKTNIEAFRALAKMPEEQLVDALIKDHMNVVCELVCRGHCDAVPTLEKSAAQVCREKILAWFQQPSEEV